MKRERPRRTTLYTRYAITALEHGIQLCSEVEAHQTRPRGLPHRHDGTQLLWMLDGSMGMLVGDKAHVLVPGALLIVPPRIEHLIYKTGDCTVSVYVNLVLTSEAGLPMNQTLQALEPGAHQLPPADVAAQAAELKGACTRTGLLRTAGVMACLWRMIALTQQTGVWTSPRSNRGTADRRIELALAFMHANLSNSIGVPDIAAAVGLSRSQLSRLFREQRHTTPAAFLKALRIGLAKRLLADPSLSVKEIALTCGFPCANHFSRVFSSATGHPPSAHR